MKYSLISRLGYNKADKLTQAQGAKAIPLWRLYRVLHRGHTCVPS